MEYAMHIEPDELGYHATFPDLPGCFTQGDTIGELIHNAEDAVETYLSVLREDGDPIPEPKHRVATVVVPTPAKKAG